MLHRHVRTVVLVACLVTSPLALAGQLNPPAGPVGATPKPLAEIEPRIAINAQNTPGDNDSVFRITAPGSYYLTESFLGGDLMTGIEIAASNVTVDLNGFTVEGKAESLSGIGTDPDEFTTYERIVIRNGTITGWGAEGIKGNRFFNSIVSDVIASNNGFNGILLESYSLVENCIASGNGSNGFSLNRSNIIRNCTARANEGSGISVNFINEIRDCISTVNSGDGFITGIGNIIEGNLAESNQGDGFDLFHDNFVRNNYAYRNGIGVSVGYGFFSNDEGSQFEGNVAAENDEGFRILGAGNLLIRNSARGNTVQYNIAAGNTVGPTVTSATIGASTNPHANYSY